MNTRINIHELLKIRRDRALIVAFMSGFFFVAAFVAGSMRADFYTPGENKFLTILMLIGFGMGILTLAVDWALWKGYERLRLVIVGKGRKLALPDEEHV